MIWDERTFAAYCDGIALTPPHADATVTERCARLVGVIDRVQDSRRQLDLAAERTTESFAAFATAYEAATWRIAVAPLEAAHRNERRKAWSVQRRKYLSRQRRR